MEIKQVSPNDLKPHPKNPRIHHAIDKIVRSIETYGFTNPVLVQKDTNLIIAGHGRVEAAKKMGLSTVPILELDLSDTKSQAYLIADNKLATESDWENNLLKNVLVDLKAEDYDLTLTGFDTDELLKLFPVPDEEDPVPTPPLTARSQVGAVYTLGRHRLMCGDSTNEKDVELLMSGEIADMCFTSPPYNLGENSKLRGWLGTGRDKIYENYDDKKSEDNWFSFMKIFTEIALNNSKYVFVNVQSLAGNRTALPRYWNNFSEFFADVCIWDKKHAAPALAERVMNSQFEFIFIFTKENPCRAISIAPAFRGTLPNVYTADPNESRQEFAKIHGAVFPTYFASHFIQNFTENGMTIFEPFAGSGTVMIACENLHRNCRMMEVDPIYVDVIIQRYCNHTGANIEEIYSSAVVHA